ncbi:SRPBCC family protein [Streptomyces sp. NPDC016845]|uniref:SRPBCC family protein n=1 Tax=Streptomyces sp. NPDC016845 TaxID=3364972 RepID=UPI0037B9C835
MRLIETSVDISADTNDVWNILVDFDRYAEWNPFIVHARGTAVRGTLLEITMRLEDREMTFTPRVTEVEPGRHLQWLGQFRIPKVFDGRHEFIIEPAPHGATLRHRESFAGLLPPFLGSMLARTAAAFEQFNLAIKARAEGTA